MSKTPFSVRRRNYQVYGKPVRWHLILAAVYVCVLVFSVAYMHIATDEFRALLAICVTLPWSLIAISIISLMQPDVFRSLVAGTVIVCLSGALNLFIILSIPRFLKWIKQK